jgi:hypothetical protein
VNQVQHICFGRPGAGVIVRTEGQRCEEEDRQIPRGDDGVRAYTAPPLIPDRSGLARRQARVWSDADGTRLDIARRMYAWRLGEILPHTDIATLRGIEGARVKEMYKLQAQRFGIKWNGRRYDRANPNAAVMARLSTGPGAVFGR